MLIEEANDTETLRTYSYNYLDRLASFDDGSVLVNYTYSPDDIRTRATVNGSDIDYLIDPFNHYRLRPGPAGRHCGRREYGVFLWP